MSDKTQQPPIEEQENAEGNDRQGAANYPSREELIAAIRGYAEKIGRAPKWEEFARATKVPIRHIRHRFGTYTKALRACGFEGEGQGYKVSLEKLFEDWAGIVRSLGKIPTQVEYDKRSRFSIRPLKDLFGGWGKVPAGMLEYMEDSRLDVEWADVRDMLRRHCEGQGRTKERSAATLNWPEKARSVPDRVICGSPLVMAPMLFAPSNEDGVLVLFGMLAERLGFMIAWVGTEFPDCEAFRELGAGRWQRVRIEFEFVSRNFVLHGHNPADCDLIVCWEDNWKQSPVPVLELKRVVSIASNAKIAKSDN